MPNLAWTIVMGLVTSVIGGVLASWLVLRGHEHDLKRVYARQIWSDFHAAVSTLYSHSYSLINVIDSSIVADIRLSVSDEQSIKDFNTRLRSLAGSGDLQNKIRRCDKQSLVTILTWLTNETITEQGKFRRLFTIYPIQISHFGEWYHTKIWLDTVFKDAKSNLASDSPNGLEGYAS